MKFEIFIIEIPSGHRLQTQDLPNAVGFYKCKVTLVHPYGPRMGEMTKVRTSHIFEQVFRDCVKMNVLPPPINGSNYLGIYPKQQLIGGYPQLTASAHSGINLRSYPKQQLIRGYPQIAASAHSGINVGLNSHLQQLPSNSAFSHTQANYLLQNHTASSVSTNAFPPHYDPELVLLANAVSLKISFKII